MSERPHDWPGPSGRTSLCPCCCCCCSWPWPDALICLILSSILSFCCASSASPPARACWSSRAAATRPTTGIAPTTPALTADATTDGGCWTVVPLWFVVDMSVSPPLSLTATAAAAAAAAGADEAAIGIMAGGAGGRGPLPMPTAAARVCMKVCCWWGICGWERGGRGWAITGRYRASICGGTRFSLRASSKAALIAAVTSFGSTTDANPASCFIM
mmetsp:Transcript_18604/g.53166  ORF Transcript_18604/g.53166 Transcript_18604/m.53166 type:complete len:216 (+) Transcript_18604:1032-1679(+)